MTGSQLVAGSRAGEVKLVLGVDTCGPSGTVALALVVDEALEILGQKELAGRTYSATLIAAVGELLAEAGTNLRHIAAIVVVNGPGSFTGVRVGVSAVKGLAEPGIIPVVAVSRLAVLAAKAGVGSAALDAHRQEVYLRVAEEDGSSRQLLAGADEISHISEARCGAPTIVAVCDEGAEMIATVWGGVELRRAEAPTAADAIRLAVPAILAGEFTDLALLDGHYLRRSDAEIFGEAAVKAAGQMESGVRVRRMESGDIDGVMEIAAMTDHAPRWGRSAYVAAMDPENQPRRVALVAERGGGLAGFVVAAILPGGEAELESIVTAVPHQRGGVARALFTALKPELRRQGVREVMLEVREGNHSAQGFYRFLGFREEGRRAGYYANPVEDAVLMKVALR